MEKVAVVLRYLQFYAHISHNLTKGPTFFSDHEFLGELYPAYEAAYDSVVERMIGTGKKPDLFKIHSQASMMLSKVNFMDISSALSIIQDAEKTLCRVIEKEVLPNPMSHPHGGSPGLSQGEVQLVGDIANQSEMRQYKIGQRLNR